MRNNESTILQFLKIPRYVLRFLANTSLLTRISIILLLVIQVFFALDSYIDTVIVREYALSALNKKIHAAGFNKPIQDDLLRQKRYIIESAAMKSGVKPMLREENKYFVRTLRKSYFAEKITRQTFSYFYLLSVGLGGAFSERSLFYFFIYFLIGCILCTDVYYQIKHNAH